MSKTVQFEVLPVKEEGAGAAVGLSPSKRTRSKSTQGISWSHVDFVVGEGKYVLKDCWGEVSPGNVCAIMGPSGAGKSSLLNVLAGRSSSGPNIKISGHIKVAGKEINPVAYRRNIAYVMQDDALLPTHTPREALRFSAYLRLPATMTAVELDDMVSNVLTRLGLTDCADVLIGGAMIKGISGGQRKRTSVGVEVITDPSLLFLDEPTSGLDSFSAFNLVNLLKELGAGGTTILCTLHQPSSEVFFLFDTVIYMKDGQIFYQGLTNDIVPYFSEKGKICPENYNPSDFVMNLAQQDSLSDLEAMGMMMPIPPQFATEPGSSSKRLDSEQLDFTSEAGFFRQVGAITYREIENTCRDIPALIGRFGVTIVLNLLYGLIFLNRGSKNNGNTENFNAHVGAISMIVISALFGSGQSVLLAFPFERPMILREYATGTYSMTSYFLSKLVVEAPLTFLQTIVQFLLVFYMVELQGSFIMLVLACWGLGMVSNSTAMGIGCLVPDVKDATELAPLVYVPQILFAGFFIRTGQIPVFLRWAQYLCGMKYAFNLVILSEFSLSTETCSSPAAAANCQEIQSANGIDGSIFYVYIILLFVLFVLYRVAGVLILIQKAKRFY